MISTAQESNVFGVPLKESLRYASVQISTANKDGEMYVWGYIPVVVAKWSVLVEPLFNSLLIRNAIVDYISKRRVHVPRPAFFLL